MSDRCYFYRGTGFGALLLLLVGCGSYYGDEVNVKRYRGIDYKTTLPQEFDHILYSRLGTLDSSQRVVNSGTLMLEQDRIHYANNTDSISIDYDDIVDIKRIQISPAQRDTWVQIRFREGDEIRKTGFRGDRAMSHPWTGDRIFALLRDTLEARKQR